MRNKGQSIIELVVAIGISALVMVSLLNVVVRSLYNSGLARQKAQGTKVLLEMEEWLRRSRDTWGWTVFLADIGSRTSFCMESLPSDAHLVGSMAVPNAASSTPCPGQVTGTPFYRYLTISNVSSNEINFSGVVLWSDSKGDHTSQSIFKLSNWR